MDIVFYKNQSLHNNPHNFSYFEEFDDDPAAIKWPYQLIVLAAYTLAAVIAFLSNLVTIVVLTFGQRSSPELKRFLINLAFCDVVMSLFAIPYNYTAFMYGRWLFADQFCPIASAMQMFACFVSAYTLVAIGIDRYFAITRPLKPFNIHPMATLLIIWLLGSMMAVVTYFTTVVEKVSIGDEVIAICVETWQPGLEMQSYTVFVFALNYLLPFAMLGYVYGCMGRKVFGGRQLLPQSSCPNQANVKRKMHAVKMLITVVIAFVVCWLPIQIFYLFVFLPVEGPTFSTRFGYYLYVVCYFVFHWLSMVHSCANPFIYSFMSSNFRKDFSNLRKRLFHKLAGKCLYNAHLNHSFKSYKTVSSEIAVATDFVNK